MSILNHTKITVDDRCIDLLLTEDEITRGFERFLDPNNKSFINMEECCKCWPINKPPKCNFWKKIIGLCIECQCNKS